jgi:hypothetical protein
MRKYNIVSDLVQVKSIQPIVYKQYDNGDNLEVELFEDGEKINLTDETILAFFQLEDNTVIQKTCTVNVDGNAVATLDSNILSKEGKVKVEFTVYDNDKETTIRTILLNVEQSINRNEAIETVPQFDIVDQILAQVSNPKTKSWTATSGQRSYTFTDDSYTLGQLSVYVGGVQQMPVINFTQDSTTSFTLICDASEITAGMTVYAVYR